MSQNKKIVLDPKNQFTILKETMSLATKFHPDPSDPTQYKRKRCYLQLFAIGNGEPKAIGVLSFNLSDFIKISPKNTVKLSFTKCFDKKAAIFLSTSVKEIDQNCDFVESESNVTMDMSDTFSECSSNFQNIEVVSQSQMQSSFSTSDETNKSVQNDYPSRNNLFSSFSKEENNSPSIKMLQKSNLSKESLLNHKLMNEVAHYKELLSEMNQKFQELAKRLDQKDTDDTKRK